MNISIKNVPKTLVEQLRVRAKQNHRSLQGELLNMLEQQVKPSRLNLDEVRWRLRELDFQTGDDSREIIRQDRDAG
jgi:plasmid stability protein